MSRRKGSLVHYSGLSVRHAFGKPGFDSLVESDHIKRFKKMNSQLSCLTFSIKGIVV